MKRFVAAIVLVCVCGFTGCGGELNQNERTRFTDHPEKFKGKTVCMKVLYDGGGLRQGGRLFQMPLDVFINGGLSHMTLEIPPGIDLPSIEPNQNLLITFVCEKGDLHEGNKAVRVQRSKTAM